MQLLKRFRLTANGEDIRWSSNVMSSVPEGCLTCSTKVWSCLHGDLRGCLQRNVEQQQTAAGEGVWDEGFREIWVGPTGQEGSR